MTETSRNWLDFDLGALAGPPYVRVVAERIRFDFRAAFITGTDGVPRLALETPPAFPKDGGIAFAVEAARRRTEARSFGWKPARARRRYRCPLLPWFPTLSPAERAWVWIHLLSPFAVSPDTMMWPPEDSIPRALRR